MLPETLKTRLRTYYQNNYVTYLAQVEANHTDDPSMLEDFKQHLFSNVRMFQTSRDYPYWEVATTVSRAVGETQQDPLAGPWGTIVEIRKRFRDTDIERLAKTIDRHIEAFVLMVTADARLGRAFPLGFTELEFRVIESNEPFFQGLLIRLRAKHKV